MVYAGDKLGPLLVFEKGGISSVEYIKTLNEGLHTFLQELNGTDGIVDEDTIQVATPGEYTFQQDNTPIHLSKASSFRGTVLGSTYLQVHGSPLKLPQRFVD